MVRVKSSILDVNGNPIEYDILDKDITKASRSSLGGIHNLLSTHPSNGLTPYKLSSILRAAEIGNADEFYDLAKDMETKYPHYLGVLGTRKRQVSQLDISVEAASDDTKHQAHADLIRKFLRRDTLKSELFGILDAIAKGVSFTEIIWDTSKDIWLPKHLKRKDQKFFTFDNTDGETPLLKNADGTNSQLKGCKYIVHVHEGISGLPIEGGIARAISWVYLFQNMTIKDWVIFAEIYGQPFRVGKYGPNATEFDKSVLLDAVTSIGVEAAAIIPESMKIEFVNAIASGNADTYFKLATYLDQQVSKAVLGQTATTDAVAGGLGGSQGNVHNDVRKDIQDADADLLASTLNRDLVRPIIDLNFGLQEDDNYPRIKIGETESFSLEDMEKIERFVKMGGNVSKSIIRDKLAIEDPANNEELLSFGTSSDVLKNSPNGADTAQTKAMPASLSPSALLEASQASNSTKNSDMAAASASTNQSDPISETIDNIDSGDFGGWSEITAPFVGAIEDALAASNSFEEFKASLIPSLEKMNPKAMTDLLSSFGFQARAYGETKNSE